MNSSSEKATVCIGIDFCHQLRKTSGRIKWAILVPFHICPLPEKPPVVFTPDEFEFGKGRPSFFRWIIPSRPDFKYYYVLILNPIFTSQFISDMLRRSFLTKHPDQLFYLVYLYFGKRHFLFPWFNLHRLLFFMFGGVLKKNGRKRKGGHPFVPSRSVFI